MNKIYKKSPENRVEFTKCLFGRKYAQILHSCKVLQVNMLYFVTSVYFCSFEQFLPDVRTISVVSVRQNSKKCSNVRQKLFEQPTVNVRRLKSFTLVLLKKCINIHFPFPECTKIYTENFQNCFYICNTVPVY